MSTISIASFGAAINFINAHVRTRNNSVDQLRIAYTDLLQHIDVAHANLGRRGIDELDVDIHKKSKRFSFRRNVIPPSPSKSSGQNASVALEETNNSTDLGTSTSTTGLMAADATTAVDHNGNYNTPLNNATTTTTTTTASSHHENESWGNGSNQQYDKENRDLAAAFRMMAATRSPDKEGDNFGAVAIRDDSFSAALNTAKAIETRVSELIHTIGELVIDTEKPSQHHPQHVDHKQMPSTVTPAETSSNPDTIGDNNTKHSQSHVRSDPVFEYFCEKSILSLLVDIAKEKRHGSEEGRRWGGESSFHGVVWSPKVKAQVFATTSLLISNCRNRSVLYYLLSHNYINELIQCMLPLQQWTDQALSKMMPPYVDMLQKLAVQLANEPDLFPFMTMEAPSETAASDEEVPAASFPLFSAALETATGAYAQSDSIVYGTCLVVAVNIMQISHEPIQSWVCNSGLEQRRLADHLCQRLLDRYYRIVNLTTGPVVDPVRSNAISGQLAALRDHMAMIHEVFWSGVRGLDVRLCESLLQRVVTILLKNLAISKGRQFLSNVGLVDADVIPEQEALAQVSTIFLSLLFSTLTYIPFNRMMTVALLHEKSTPLWSSHRWMKNMDSSETYIFMPILSDIVTGDNERETCPNKFRAEISKGVSGTYGAWRTTACACLLQTALSSEAMDHESLCLLKVIPEPDRDTYQATSLEEAISAYLIRPHKPSAIVAQTLEYVGMLAIQTLGKILILFTKDENNIEERINFVLSHSPLWKGLLQARSFFANEAMKYQKITGVSDIFLDLVESTIANRYTARYSDSGGATSYRCPLDQRGSVKKSINPEILVRKFRDVSANDIENSRFHLNMTLHFRALCKVIDRLGVSIRKETRSKDSSGETKRNICLDLVDKADEVTRIVGGLVEKPDIGTHLDLTGRMTFRFYPVVKASDVATSPERTSSRSASRIKSLSEDMRVFLSKNDRLMLVLDPTGIYVVRPMKSKMEENRATVICSISLRCVIAAADDGEWLHVAVRHEDVGFLIKNGNMALQFENNGACLIVKQYLDRSREVLRQELFMKVSKLLDESMNDTLVQPTADDSEESLE